MDRTAVIAYWEVVEQTAFDEVNCLWKGFKEDHSPEHYKNYLEALRFKLMVRKVLDGLKFSLGEHPGAEQRHTAEKRA